MKKIHLLLIMLSALATSCTQKTKPFTVKKVKKENYTTLSYTPQMPFVEVRDSAYHYFTAEDNEKIFTAEISRGNIIARTNYYHVRVMLRNYKRIDTSYFELLLRTFSVDGKIIDTIVIGSTLEDAMCEGVFDGASTITRSCNGKKEVLKINDLGKFIPTT